MSVYFFLSLGLTLSLGNFFQSTSIHLLKIGPPHQEHLRDFQIFVFSKWTFIQPSVSIWKKEKSQFFRRDEDESKFRNIVEKYSSREVFLLFISKSPLSSIPLFTLFSHPTTLLFNAPPFLYPGQCCQIPAILPCHSRQKLQQLGEFSKFFITSIPPIGCFLAGAGG
jgi:hypothetical protein